MFSYLQSNYKVVNYISSSWLNQAVHEFFSYIRFPCKICKKFPENFIRINSWVTSMLSVIASCMNYHHFWEIMSKGFIELLDVFVRNDQPVLCITKSFQFLAIMNDNNFVLKKIFEWCEHSMV